jgi:hypothetical protein
MALIYGKAESFSAFPLRRRRSHSDKLPLRRRVQTRYTHERKIFPLMRIT